MVDFAALTAATHRKSGLRFGKSIDTALDPTTLEVIDALAREYEDTRAKLAKLEACKEELSAELRGILEGVDAKSISSTAYKVVHVKQAGKWYLDEKKLMLNGVEPEVIAASKSQGKGNEHVRIYQSAKGYTPEVVRRGPEDQADGASGNGEGE